MSVTAQTPFECNRMRSMIHHSINKYFFFGFFLEIFRFLRSGTISSTFRGQLKSFSIFSSSRECNLIPSEFNGIQHSKSANRKQQSNAKQNWNLLFSSDFILCKQPVISRMSVNNKCSVIIRIWRLKTCHGHYAMTYRMLGSKYLMNLSIQKKFQCQCIILLSFSIRKIVKIKIQYICRAQAIFSVEPRIPLIWKYIWMRLYMFV